MSRPRVVITGLSAITPLGNDLETTWKRLLAGESGIGPITLFAATDYDSRVAGEVKDFVAEDFIPAKQARRMDRFTQFAVVAAQQLLKDSGLVINDDNAYDVGVILGIGLGGLKTIETYHAKLLQGGPGKVSPFLIPMLISNMGPGQIAIFTGAKGPNIVTTTACASAIHGIGTAFSEILLGRRRERNLRTSRFAVWFEKEKRLHSLMFLGGSCALAGIILFCSFFTIGTTVSYDGQVLGRLASKSEAETVRKDLESITSRTLGKTYTIDDSLLQYDSGWMLRQDIEDKAVYEDQLSDEIGLVTSAYCLYVNDVRIGATPYEGALEELLDQLQKAASDEDTISCEFAEDVEIRQEYVPTSEIMNLGYIAELLYSTKTAEVTYEVKKGDTWSQIAAKNDMTSAELLALNPGYNINKLQIGEVLTLSASVPYLTMTVVKQERYLDDVSYNIEYTDSADLYQGDYKVTSKGEYGKADVMAKATYVNGEETERTILSSVTLKEPVTEYRLRGTKVRPTWMPTGSFRWPTSGRISSYFGGRKSPGGIGSTNHKGSISPSPEGHPSTPPMAAP